MFARLSQLSRHLKKPIMSFTANASSDSSVSDPFKRPIRTAACLIIGDEVLNGKTVDTNSAFFAKYCFNLGINLKRIEVISDNEEEIIEAARRMSANYDFVVTSGGIGPTHDDITYPTMARAFNLPLSLHEETARRMRALSRQRPDAPPFDWDTPSPTLTARLRMAQLPTGPSAKVIYVSEKIWVPICAVNYNVHILPGVPSIFESLLEGLKPMLIEDGRVHDGLKQTRIMISTQWPESEIAEFLTGLQERVKDKGIKVGSYPRWGTGRNTVTLLGTDKEYLESFVPEVEAGIGGHRIQVEGEDDGEPKELHEEAGNAIVDIIEEGSFKAK
ncbi:hypothetical protein RUND412_006259 [Rhizina undulata]